MRETVHYLLWVIGLTVWTVVCFITPYFMDNPVDGWYSMAVVFAHISACGIGAFLILYAIGCSRYLTAVVLPLWALLGAALAFYRVGYHVTLTTMLIAVTLHTNPEEAMGVLSWQLVLWVAVQMMIACLAVWWRWKRIQLTSAWVHGLIAVVCVGCYIGSSYRLREVILYQRFPLNIVHYGYLYVAGLRPAGTTRTVPSFTIEETTDSLTVVLVIGEATRADHMQMNGYERETTPLLSARKNVIAFPHIFSEQTYTDICLPHMLTRADSAHEEFQYSETSFIRIYQAAGFRTAWLSNQDLGHAYRDYIEESDTMIFANAGKSQYVYSQWLDGELLPLIKEAMPAHPAKALYILHTIGSHWYYNNHVPQNMYHFQPLTTNRVVTNNGTERLVNSYDNTIRYMDYFVDSLISTIEDKRAILIFQSDHGEALGEGGLYLHGHEIPGVQNPACFVWYSDKYAETYPEKIKALVRNKNKRYRTDYLFYSVLSAAGIEADGDSPEMNIFR